MNRYLKLSLLALCGFVDINLAASQSPTRNYGMDAFGSFFSDRKIEISNDEECQKMASEFMSEKGYYFNKKYFDDSRSQLNVINYVVKKFLEEIFQQKQTLIAKQLEEKKLKKYTIFVPGDASIVAKELTSEIERVLDKDNSASLVEQKIKDALKKIFTFKEVSLQKCIKKEGPTIQDSLLEYVEDHTKMIGSAAGIAAIAGLSYYAYNKKNYTKSSSSSYHPSDSESEQQKNENHSPDNHSKARDSRGLEDLQKRLFFASDDQFIDTVIQAAPKEIQTIIDALQKDTIPENRKNIILYGYPEEGKSILAKAIAAKCDFPCLLYDAGSVYGDTLTSYRANLNQVFKEAQQRNLSLNKKCVIIFDNLENLIRSNSDQTVYNYDPLINFWRKVEEFTNKDVIIIGTLDRKVNFPSQITNRTVMQEVTPPTQYDKEIIGTYYLNKASKKHGITFDQTLPKYIAKNTFNFSRGDMSGVLAKGITSSQLNRSDKTVNRFDFYAPINSIKSNPVRTFDRNLGTWKHSFKVGAFKLIPYAIPTTVALSHLYYTRHFGFAGLENQGQLIDIAKKQLKNSNQQTKNSNSSLNNQYIGLGLSSAGITLGVLKCAAAAAVTAGTAPISLPAMIAISAGTGLATVGGSYYLNNRK